MKKLVTVLAAVLVIVVILVGVVQWTQNQEGTPPGVPVEEPTETLSQPEHCADVEFISAPGTWESSATDDPFAPSANPNSFMLAITAPLQAEVDPARVKVWTLPYTAQFRNINAQQEMSYDDSRNEGTARLEEELRATHAECPLTDFILAGFSQGAVIVGDVVSAIGNGTGVIPAERVRGVTVIADGRRQPGVGQVVGNPVSGVGAEVALQPLNLLVQPIVPGATMRGGRPGGFGVLNEKVNDICAASDSICDAPEGVGNALARAQELAAANGVHALYASNPNVIPGTTADQWTLQWARDLIG
ncbi:cutinase family protein [Corynebacterium sp. 153RC1]|uniref:cutinase family protein n=1 Tax=unclassified Corynebacterium TaxID=2624378 RepID=UPI00211BE2FB|nr:MULTISPECIES: cutinase family protein [unclassified Corynebacterium]MCQ9370456.1 cutinase family protein [Corynebacterium sp. 35RC1]MCQ9352694.1 cutinase family protein [Corynebacterium sp. 209RC1]MCQ9354878.1 cutinase family protein [Corynebacterium sp. 1222RC1]MCQ9357063.1 cutinase family protein [Corynebacterium sp. 122RC1]MCQ9359309.1 cutinase family protein [Corynebacterium sp. 142RC1]